MTRRMGFTLVEAVVVVAATTALGVVLAMHMGGCSTGKGHHELARRASCKANLRSIGQALGMYEAANNGQWPWLVSDNRWDAPTGAGQQRPPSGHATYNVSALLFLLVRSGQSPGIFVCPSTPDTPDPNLKSGPAHDYDYTRNYNWDFSPFRAGGAEHVSYSYQAPFVDAAGSSSSGVNVNSDPNLVILADRTPTYDGKTATFNWASPGKADPRTGMSQNHTKGEIVNLLYADMHVGDSVRADVGINKDNIYSCADSRGDPPAPATNRGPGTLDMANHRSTDDSFLLGPKKMP